MKLENIEWERKKQREREKQEGKEKNKKKKVGKEELLIRNIYGNKEKKKRKDILNKNYFERKKERIVESLWWPSMLILGKEKIRFWMSGK